MNNKTLFHILLVLTMIWTGMSALSYLGMGLMLPTMKQILADNPSLMPEQFGVMMERMLDAPRSFYLVSSLLFLLELLGAVFMWRLRWSGFHCYTLARLLLLLLPALFLGRAFVGAGDIMMAILFVAVYYLLMRQLTGNTDHSQESDQLTPQE